MPDATPAASAPSPPPPDDPTPSRPVSAPPAGWPPPGLEVIQGSLAGAVTLTALGDLVLIPPLLAALASDSVGDAWWLPVAATAVGGSTLVAGLTSLAQFGRRAATATRLGHDWRMILYVATDGARDAGFLLQRARMYAAISTGQRDIVVRNRVSATLLSLGATVLAPLGVAASVILGRLGRANESFLWVVACLLPLTLLLAAGVTAARGAVIARSARKRAGAGVLTDETRNRVAAWQQAFAATRDSSAATGGRSAGPFRLGALSMAVVSVVVMAPITALVLVGAVIQIISSIATPSFGQTQARLAAAEALRPYRPASRPGLSDSAAGVALNTLLGVGRDSASFRLIELRPSRSYRDSWWPPDALRDGVQKRFQDGGMVFDAARKLSPAERRYLERVAANPAHAEFATVAAAGGAQIVATRYRLPFPDTMTWSTIPVPAYRPVREGIRAHLAIAALHATQGRADVAEREVREVVGVGFLLLDHGPTLLDNLIGAIAIGAGGDALEALYRSSGRQRQATSLADLREGVRRAVGRTGGVGATGSLAGDLRAMSRLVLDTSAALGLRWESFGIASQIARCASLKQLVFGPGQPYRDWLASARATLVHDAGDAELFALLERGAFGAGRCLPPWRYLNW